MAQRIRQSRGYVTAAEGAVVGAFAFAVAGGCLGWLHAQIFPREGLDQLTPPAVGVMVAAWPGAAVGCSTALRARRQRAAVSTGVILVVMTSLLIAMGYRLQHYGGAGSRVEAVGVALGVSLPFLARHLALAAHGSLQGRVGVDRRLVMTACGLTAVTTLVVVFLPIVVAERGRVFHHPLYGVGREVVDKRTTMARQQGFSLVGAMALAAAAPLLLDRTRLRKAAQGLAAAVLLVGAVVSASRAGVFYVPAGLLMLMAAVHGARERNARGIR